MHGPLDRLERVAPSEYVEKQLTGNADWEESRALKAVFEWATSTHDEIYRRIEKPILETRTTIKFSDIPTTDFAPNDWDAVLAHLQKKFRQLETEILYANLSVDSVPGVHVVHTIVPGMEGETMSYGRIGRRNFEKLLERQKTDERIGKLVGYGDDSPPETAQLIHLTKADKLKFPKAWLDLAAVARQVGDFYALYREPESFAVGRILRHREILDQTSTAI
jgi:ribosomal protein S12 methylthiotransferase accessory factor